MTDFVVVKTHPNMLLYIDMLQKKNAEALSFYPKQVFERDNYTCQKCGDCSGNGHAVELHPHHIQPFATNLALRYDLNNGITLCKSCHRKEHNHVFIGRVSFHTSGKP